MATTIKRQQEPQHIVADLLKAEIREKQARSIKYQLTEFPKGVHRLYWLVFFVMAQQRWVAWDRNRLTVTLG